MVLWAKIEAECQKACVCGGASRGSGCPACEVRHELEGERQDASIAVKRLSRELEVRIAERDSVLAAMRAILHRAAQQRANIDRYRELYIDRKRLRDVIARVSACGGCPTLSAEEWGTVIDNGEECCFCPFVTNTRCTAYDIEFLHQEECPLCGRTDDHVHDMDEIDDMDGTSRDERVMPWAQGR